MKRTITTGNERHAVTLYRTSDGPVLKIDEAPAVAASLEKISATVSRVTVGEITEDVRMIYKGDEAFIQAYGRTFTMNVLDPIDQAVAAATAGDLSVKAPMPGLVVELHVAENDLVGNNQPLLTIESMKLLTVISSNGEGVVEKLHFEEGSVFNKGATLISIQAMENSKDA